MSTTLGTVREATGAGAVEAFLDQHVLSGTEWRLQSVRRRSERLDPPNLYWAVYRVRIERGRAGESDASAAEQRELRLVARAVFDPDAWVDYRDRLRQRFGAKRCDPLGGLGYPVAFDETQHAFWFFPVDPALTTLVDAADPGRMRRFFREHKHQVLDQQAGIAEVTVERARYLPEGSALLRYQLNTDPPAAAKTIYGKVHRGHDGERTFRILRDLWNVSQSSEGMLRIPRPLAYHPDLRLILQDAAPGQEVASDRTSAEFIPAAVAAAEALATIHDAHVSTAEEMTIEPELGRLDEVVDQLALVHPPAVRLLRQLLERIRNRISRTPEEEWLPTHGDLKYDQLLHHNGQFSLVDFDYFGVGETSWDLAKYTAHAIPSMPQKFEETVAAEEARSAFLRRYLELRPEATRQRFPIYEATHLAARAMVLMWSQMPGWQDSAESLLILAVERLKQDAP